VRGVQRGHVPGRAIHGPMAIWLVVVQGYSFSGF